VITTTGTDPASDVAAGRSMQRAWFALTRRGLVAQPMSSLAALEASYAMDVQAAAPNAQADRIAAVLAALRAAFPGLEKGARIALLIRFGWAQAPTARVRRLPVEDSVAVIARLAPPASAPAQKM